MSGLECGIISWEASSSLPVGSGTYYSRLDSVTLVSFISPVSALEERKQDSESRSDV